MNDWTIIKFSAKMNDTTRAELEKRLPALLEAIGISEYNFDEAELSSAETTQTAESEE